MLVRENDYLLKLGRGRLGTFCGFSQPNLLFRWVALQLSACRIFPASLFSAYIVLLSIAMFLADLFLPQTVSDGLSCAVFPPVICLLFF
ncbi:hypothetical protein [Aliamphritea spongicola]|nr:hypothetical protein [Aliamphritea spongicola]